MTFGDAFLKKNSVPSVPISFNSVVKKYTSNHEIKL